MNSQILIEEPYVVSPQLGADGASTAFTYRVPEASTWGRWQALRIISTTLGVLSDATAANRSAALLVLNRQNVRKYASGSSLAQTASQAVLYVFADFGDNSASVGSVFGGEFDSVRAICMPFVPLEPGDLIQMTLTGNQVGDSFLEGSIVMLASVFPGRG